MVYEDDEVLQRLRKLTQRDSAFSRMTMRMPDSESGSVQSHEEIRRAKGSHRMPNKGKSLRSYHTRSQKTTRSLPKMLGSPLISAVTILILTFFLSLSLVLLTIQGRNISTITAARHESLTSQSSDSSQKDKSSALQIQQQKQKQQETNNQSQVTTQSQPQTGIDQNSTASPPSSEATNASMQGVNINLASVDELQEIPGVGPVTAQKIVTYRSEHGAFKTIDDLLDVSGIGAKTLEKMRSHVRVQ